MRHLITPEGVACHPGGPPPGDGTAELTLSRDDVDCPQCVMAAHAEGYTPDRPDRVDGERPSRKLLVVVAFTGHVVAEVTVDYAGLVQCLALVEAT